MFRMEEAGDVPHPPGPLPPVRKVMIDHTYERYSSLFLTAAKLKSSDLRRGDRYCQIGLPQYSIHLLFQCVARSQLVTVLCRMISLHGQVMFKETNEKNDTAQNTGVRKNIARCLSWGSCMQGLSYYIFQRGCLCHHQVRPAPCPILHSS